MSSKSDTHEAPRPDLYWIADGLHARMRVWNPSWPGDCFEVLTVDEFNVLRGTCTRFGLRLEEFPSED